MHPTVQPTEPPYPHRWRIIAVPVLLAGLAVVGTPLAAHGQPDTRTLDLLGFGLLLAGPALLLARHRNPPASYAGVAAALVGYLAVDYPLGPVFLSALAALATTVSTGHRRAAYTITAVAFGSSVLIDLLQDPAAPALGALGWLTWLAVFIAGCELWRARRDRLAQAAATLAETARRRASEERLALARDLHDTLGHHISLINVQAGVALHLLDTDPADPEQARTALTAIKASSRDLLRELRTTLGVLRGVEEDPPRHPVAGLARLDDLAAENRAAGLLVRVERLGDLTTLSPSLDLVVYRILQEALTNTRRHADATYATVRVSRTPDRVEIQVDDNGNGPTTGGAATGNGLPGMTERATTLGGTCSTGKSPDGGFRVHAVLPIREGAPGNDASTSTAAVRQ